MQWRRRQRRQRLAMTWSATAIIINIRQISPDPLPQPAHLSFTSLSQFALFGPLFLRKPDYQSVYRSTDRSLYSPRSFTEHKAPAASLYQGAS